MTTVNNHPASTDEVNAAPNIQDTTVVVIAIALSLVGAFGIFAAPIMSKALLSIGLTGQEAGYIVGAEIGGGALSSLLAIFWIKKINWRTTALLAVTLIITLNIISTFQSEANILIVLRFTAGFFGQGTCYAIVIAIINQQRNPDKIFGFTIATQIAFSVLMLLFLPSLIEQQGLSGILWPLAIVALMILPFLFKLPTTASKPSTQHKDTSHANPSLGLPITSLLILLIWCSGLGAIWTFLLDIGTAGGLSIEDAGLAISISSALAITGALSASALAEKMSRLVSVSIALCMQIIALTLLQGEMSFVGFVSTFLLFQVFWNFAAPYLMGLVVATDTDNRISVLIPAAQSGGFSIGPIIAGSFMVGENFQAANYVGIAGCAIALLIAAPTIIVAQRRSIDT